MRDPRPITLLLAIAALLPACGRSSSGTEAGTGGEAAVTQGAAPRSDAPVAAGTLPGRPHSV